MTGPTNKSSLNEVVLAIGAWNVSKRPAPSPGRSAGLIKGLKQQQGTHLEDQACILSWGQCLKEPFTNYETEKGKFKQCEKVPY
jgi:hypothetical protein